ncbi:hypothetical protein HY988_03060 [Candidatus Micrarchaeota archaeon]|nr:hypothetical protein [Candidatus Micrarchaeota archaeon]
MDTTYEHVVDLGRAVFQPVAEGSFYGGSYQSAIDAKGDLATLLSRVLPDFLKPDPLFGMIPGSSLPAVTGYRVSYRRELVRKSVRAEDHTPFHQERRLSTGISTTPRLFCTSCNRLAEQCTFRGQETGEQRETANERITLTFGEGKLNISFERRAVANEAKPPTDELAVRSKITFSGVEGFVKIVVNHADFAKTIEQLKATQKPVSEKRGAGSGVVKMTDRGEYLPPPKAFSAPPGARAGSLSSRVVWPKDLIKRR